MLNFVNNWQSSVELAQGATTAALELPDGEYRITLADAAGQAATRWEIIGAAVADGVATLERGLEGTANQDWPEGSIAYVGITAGALQAMQQATADARAVADEALVQAGAAGGRFGRPRVPIGQSFCPFEVTPAGAKMIGGSQLLAVPFEVDAPVQVDAYGVRVNIAVADGTVRVGLYSADADGWPADLLNSAYISTNATGHSQADTYDPIELLPGRLYWFAAKLSGAINLYTSVGAYFALTGSGDGVCALQRSVASGLNLPDPWGFTPSDIPSLAANPPFISMRRSA